LTAFVVSVVIDGGAFFWALINFVIIALVGYITTKKVLKGKKLLKNNSLEYKSLKRK